MTGSQKSSPSKNFGPLTRGRYRKILSKSKAKRSPVKGRTSPTLVKSISGVTGSQLKNFRSPKKENDLSKLSEEEQLQKVLEESKIESLTPDEQMKLAIAESLRDLNDFSCPFCSYSASQNSDLKKHSRIVHKVDLDYYQGKNLINSPPTLLPTTHLSHH